MNKTQSKIEILPDKLINKIAAGEVIERPASVLRELLDNSIDASAENIEVNIVYGGKKLIMVSDDGCGMDREDAAMSIERHSTSKIKTEEDLFNINTLGFRGEALSSIASISRLTMSTSSKKDSSGTQIEFSDGKKEIKDAPPIKGTIVEIRDIFHNTPARRKYLKKTTTELSHVLEIFIQKAIVYPKISFILTHDGKEIIRAPRTDNLDERIVQIYGSDQLNELLQIEETQFRSLKIYGYICKPERARRTRNNQHIFVNKRAVKNPTISHAVYSAYKNLLSANRHPFFYLFIKISPREIDVNVHPSKMEIRFEDSEVIYRKVLSTLKKTLTPFYERIPESVERKVAEVPSQSYTFLMEKKTEKRDDLNIQNNFLDITNFNSCHPLSSFYIGEAFLALKVDGGLTIMDQHAAHERVLYEKFQKKIAIVSESLLFPAVIELPPKESNIIINNREKFLEVGIDIEPFGKDTVVVRSLPKDFSGIDIKNLLIDLSTGIIETEKTENSEEDIQKTIAARLACHSSIRGAQEMSEREILYLYQELMKTDVPSCCPHGRPTIIRFNIKELKKLFKRTG